MHLFSEAIEEENAFECISVLIQTINKHQPRPQLQSELYTFDDRRLPVEICQITIIKAIIDV